MSLPVDLLKFALLFSTLYAAFGVASPFLPELLSLHGLNPELLGLTLSLATTIRLISAPLAGRIADRRHSLRIVLATCAALGGVAALVLFSSGCIAVGFALRRQTPGLCSLDCIIKGIPKRGSDKTGKRCRVYSV